MVFLCGTVLTQIFTEGKDQSNHLSMMLKGRRKSCFTDLSKDKIKGSHDRRYRQEQHSLPAQSTETRETSDEEMLPLNSKLFTTLL